MAQLIPYLIDKWPDILGVIVGIISLWPLYEAFRKSRERKKKLGQAAPRSAPRTGTPARKFESSYECKPASRHELQYIHRLACKIFGSNSVSELDLMLKWHDRDPLMFHVIIKESTSPDKSRSVKKIVGYFSVMRITRAGLRKLQSGLYTGATLPLEDIDARSGVYYIGAVVAASSISKGITMSNLVSHLRSKIQDKKIKMVIARPVSDDGRRLIDKYAFEKDPGKNDLYTLKKFS